MKRNGVLLALLGGLAFYMLADAHPDDAAFKPTTNDKPAAVCGVIEGDK